MLAKKIAKNTLISAAARILGTAIALVTIGLITRYLSKAQWGDYSIILTFGGIFAVFAEFGLYQYLIKEISRPDADEKKIAGNLFTLRLIYSLFIFALAPLLALFLPYSHEAKVGILIGSLGYWFLSSYQVLMGVFQKYLRMDKVAIAEVFGRLLQLLIVFLAVRLNWGFFGVVWAMTFGGLATLLLIYFFVQKHIPVRLSFEFKFWKESLIQSYPLAISGVLTMIYFSSDSFLLSVLKPSIDVGIYRLPYKVLESLIFFPSMFVGLIMPLLSRYSIQSKEKFKNILAKSYDALIIIAVPMVLGTIAVSPEIIRLLGGGSYPEAAPILDILMLAVGMIFLGTLFSFSLIALEKQKKLLWISLFGAVFNVAANLIFIPKYSYYAAASTTLLTELLVTVLMMYYVFKEIRFLPPNKTLAKSILAFLPVMAILWQVRNWNLFLNIGWAAALYFVLLYALKGFSYSEIKSLLFEKEA